MKNYLKLFVLLCAVTISAAALSACDDHQSSNPPPPAPEPVHPNS